MERRRLDVTANTTLDYVDARAEGDGFRDEGIAVVDVESPEAEAAVTLGVEIDPGDVDHVPPHATTATLSPADARALAADLKAAADAAEAGESMTSGRGR